MGQAGPAPCARARTHTQCPPPAVDPEAPSQPHPTAFLLAAPSLPYPCLALLTPSPRLPHFPPALPRSRPAGPSLLLPLLQTACLVVEGKASSGITALLDPWEQLASAPLDLAALANRSETIGIGTEIADGGPHHVNWSPANSRLGLRVGGCGVGGGKWRRRGRGWGVSGGRAGRCGAVRQRWPTAGRRESEGKLLLLPAWASSLRRVWAAVAVAFNTYPTPL